VILLPTDAPRPRAGRHEVPRRTDRRDRTSAISPRVACWRCRARQRARPRAPLSPTLVRRRRQAAGIVDSAARAMPAIDPYLGAWRRSGARRAAAPPRDGACHAAARPDAGGRRNARGGARGGRRWHPGHAGPVHARPQSAGAGPPRRAGQARRRRARRGRGRLPQPLPSVAEQVARVEQIAAAVESRRSQCNSGQRPAMVLGRVAVRDRGGVPAHRPACPHASSRDALSTRLRRRTLSRGIVARSKNSA